MFDLSWGRQGFGAAVLMLMLTFGGYELISIPASEARFPRRDTPFALLLMIAIIFVVCFPGQLVATGTLAWLESSQTPLADAAAVFMGPTGEGLVAIGGLTRLWAATRGLCWPARGSPLLWVRKASCLASSPMCTPASTHPICRFLIFAGIALALTVSGTFAQLATLSAFEWIVFYMATCAAVPVLRRRLQEPAAFPAGRLDVPGLMVAW